MGLENVREIGQKNQMKIQKPDHLSEILSKGKKKSFLRKSKVLGQSGIQQPESVRQSAIPSV